MNSFVYFFTTLVGVLLYALQFLMLMRAVLSWLPLDEDSLLINFVYFATEPLVIPIRLLLDRFESVRSMPIDIPFLISFVLLSIVQVSLPPIG